jgi:hypothetical protein
MAVDNASLLPSIDSFHTAHHSLNHPLRALSSGTNTQIVNVDRSINHVMPISQFYGDLSFYPIPSSFGLLSTATLPGRTESLSCGAEGKEDSSYLHGYLCVTVILVFCEVFGGETRGYSTIQSHDEHPATASGAMDPWATPLRQTSGHDYACFTCTRHQCLGEIAIPSIVRWDRIRQ